MKRLSGLFFTASFLLLSLSILIAAEMPAIVNAGPDGVQRVEIIGGSYFFKPNHIVVKVNVPVEIKIRKEGGLIPHNFVLKVPEAGMDFREDLSTEPRIIRFTPTRTGTYEFLCDKKSPFSSHTHAEKGMKGVLEVTP